MTTTMEGSSVGRVGRGLGWSTFGNLMLRVGNVLSSIVMARLIAPEQFGVFAVALTVWTILGTLAEFGLGTDLVRAADMEGRAPTVATLGLATSGLFGVAMILSAPFVADVFDSPSSSGVIRLMALSLFAFGLTIVPAARLQRDYRQATLFVVNGFGMLASLGMMTTLALHDVGPASLAWGQIALQVVTVIGLYVATRTVPRFGFDPDIARKSARFCLPLAFANLLSWLLLSIDNLVVARIMGPTSLGLYVLAFNVSSWPMTAVGASLRVVALPAFSRAPTVAVRNGGLVRASAPVSAVAILMAMGLATLSGPIIAVFYGVRWSDAAVALTGLAVFGGLRVILDLVATFLIAAGTTTAVLLVQVLWIVAMVPAMWVGVSVGGLAGAAWTHLVVALLVVLPAYLVCLRRVGVDPWPFLRGWFVPLLSVLPAVAGSWWIASRSGPALVLLLLGGTAAVLLYVVPIAPWWLRQIKLLRDHSLA